MKITLNGYEIEIKAKYTAGGLINTDRRMNKADTMSLLSTVALWAFEASHRYDGLGLDALGEDASKAGNELHDQLEAAGAFKNL